MPGFFSKFGSKKPSASSTEVARVAPGTDVTAPAGSSSTVDSLGFLGLLDLWFKNEYETIEIQIENAEDDAERAYYLARRPELALAQKTLLAAFKANPTEDPETITVVMAANVYEAEGVSQVQREAWAQAQRLVNNAARGIAVPVWDEEY